MGAERKAGVKSVCFHPLIALPFVKCFVGNINIGLTEQICLHKINFMMVNLSQTDKYKTKSISKHTPYYDSKKHVSRSTKLLAQTVKPLP